MSDHVVTQIRAAIVTAIATGATLADSRVYASPVWPHEVVEDEPDASVYVRRDTWLEGTETIGKKLHMQAEIEVALRAKGSSGVDQVLEQLYGQIAAILFGNPTLGGLALYVNGPDATFDYQASEIPVGLATIRFPVAYSIVATNPFAAQL